MPTAEDIEKCGEATYPLQSQRLTPICEINDRTALVAMLLRRDLGYLCQVSLAATSPAGLEYGPEPYSRSGPSLTSQLAGVCKKLTAPATTFYGNWLPG